MHTAVVCSILANINRSKDSDHLFRPEDFIHYYFPRQGTKKQSIENMKATMMSIAKAQNLAVKKGAK